MNKNKIETLKECFTLLVTEYGDKLTEQQKTNKKELFKKIIGGYPIEKIKEMTMKMIRNRIYSNFPKIAEMIEIIEGNKEEEAELAWIYLIDKIDEVGHHQSVSFPEYPATGEIVEKWGGWSRVCDMTFKEETWKKKEFIKLYPIMKKRGEFPKQLEGQFEIDNNNKGYNKGTMLGIYSRRLDGSKVDRKLIENKKDKYLKKE